MHRCVSHKNKNAARAFRTIHLVTVTRTHFLLTGVKKDKRRLVPVVLHAYFYILRLRYYFGSCRYIQMLPSVKN